MKAKFLVETSQYQWLFPLSRSKDPIDPCQSDWIPLEYLWFSASLSSAPAGWTPWGVPQPSVPPHHLKMWPGEAGMLGTPALKSLGVTSHLGHPGQSVSSVWCQSLVAPTRLVLHPSYLLATCQTLFLTSVGHQRSVLSDLCTSPLGISVGVQVSRGGARSPVLRITTQKWWSPAVLPVTLKLLLGKGRKSQQQIHIPNSSRAIPLSVETVGQKWRETKHASHVAAPSAWASWEVASHSQPFCWGHFHPTSCPPFVLLEENGDLGSPGFFYNPVPALSVTQIQSSPWFIFYYLRWKYLYLPYTKSLPVTTTLHR